METRLEQARKLLNEKFGHRNFLDGQEKSLESIFKNRNLLVVMPTGGGKSLLFQLPAQMTKGLTLVVSPLISLMKDQVDELNHKGIQATFVNSSLGLNEQKNRLEKCINGDIKLLYVAPERFRNIYFLDTIEHIRIARLAVDEAHCISEWGHDFRPDYRKLKEFRNRVGNPLITALTATATPVVQRDIIESLGLTTSEVDIHVHGFDRPNLSISVINTPKGEHKIGFLQQLIAEQNGSGIIYTGTRKTTEELGEKLRNIENRIVVYHAGLEASERTIAQEKFMTGAARIAIATSAFGMGIDKSDVRFVSHYSYPSSVEQYYQEIGRAGRDGLTSRCDLLYSIADRRLREFFIDLSYPAREIIENVYQVLWQINQNPIKLTYQQIADRCDMKVLDGQVGSALRLLDEAGVTRALTGEPQINITLNQPGSTLLNQVRGEIQRQVLEVLASYIDMETPGRYEVSLPGVCHVSGADEDQVRRVLTALHKNDLIKYESAFRGRGVEKLVATPPPFTKLKINWHRYEMLHNAEIEKHEAIVEYIKHMGCRRDFILSYFGEKKPIKCTTCDNCAERNESDTPQDMLKEIPEFALPIILCIHHLRFRVGKTKVAQILAGSTSQDIKNLNAEKNPVFGLLSLSIPEIKSLIDDVIAEGYLEVVGGSFRPVLKLTEKGTQIALNTNLQNYKRSIDKMSDYSRHQKHHKTNDDIRMSILKCVDAYKTQYGITRIAAIVSGSKANWIKPAGADKLDVYGSVECTQEETRSIIIQMVREQLLCQVGDQNYPMLDLTESGIALLKRMQSDTGSKDIESERQPQTGSHIHKTIKLPEIIPYENLDKILNDLLESEWENVKILLIQLSIYHPGQIAVRLIKDFEIRPGMKTRSRIIWAVGELCGVYGINFLIKCASSGVDNFRRLAASALGKIANKVNAESENVSSEFRTAKKVLNELINDEAPQVRQYAKKSLKQFP